MENGGKSRSAWRGLVDVVERLSEGKAAWILVACLVAVAVLRALAPKEDSGPASWGGDGMVESGRSLLDEIADPVSDALPENGAGEAEVQTTPLVARFLVRLDEGGEVAVERLDDDEEAGDWERVEIDVGLISPDPLEISIRGVPVPDATAVADGGEERGTGEGENAP